MTVFRPSRKSTKESLDKAKAALAESTSKLEVLGNRRNTTLLSSDDDAEILTVDRQIEGMRRLARGQADRVALLEKQHAQEEAERKAELIERNEAKLAERDEVGAELQATIAKADGLFRKLIALSREADAAWPFPTSNRVPCVLLPGSVQRALEHEIYRVGARPLLYGGQDQERRAELSFPGGRSPSHELTGTPHKIQPLVDTLKVGSAHASALMRGTRAPAPPTAQQVERTPTESRLAALLVEQSRLSSDIWDESEARYRQVVTEIATLQQ